jgi:hypothetical protein
MIIEKEYEKRKGSGVRNRGKGRAYKKEENAGQKVERKIQRNTSANVSTG